MADAKPFSYKELFAKNAPEGRDAPVMKRGKYDFAVAYPDPKSMPLDGLVDALREGLAEEGDDLAIYANQSGYAPLRQFVADKVARDRGINIDIDDLIIGDGSGQPIHMICEALLDPGDVVLVENFVYSGTLGQLRRFHADIRGVDCDTEGMLPDALESVIMRATSEGKRPKFIYTIPTFQNPQGWTMTLERRKEMVRLSQKHSVPILEDDCYVDLRYEGEDVTSLHALGRHGERDVRGVVLEDYRAGNAAGLPDSAARGAGCGACGEERRRGESVRIVGGASLRYGASGRPYR